MPVKTDGNKRWVEVATLVPGSPEQVWQAIATGPGIGAWFTPTTVEERVGGAVAFDFGNGTFSNGTVLAWQPPFRFSYEERDWSKDAPPLATEVTVTSRSGDRCVVRMVHSLFSDRDTWDDEMDGFESGWPGFFEVLRLYLGKFVGQPAAVVGVTTTGSGHADAWARLTGALGLIGANVGDRRASAAGAPTLAGVVERVRQDRKSREVLLEIEQPARGLALAGIYGTDERTHAGVTLFLYGAGAADAAGRVRGDWSTWMGKLLKSEARS